MTNIVALILARGGSKRLPRKNIRDLVGKPLIAYTIDAAKDATSLSRMIVSTDDPEIAYVATINGAEVPFLRPSIIAGDSSPAIDALFHAVEWLEREGPRVDAVVLLQPTSPLRQGRHIDEAVELFRATGADTVTAVSPAPVHPFWCWKPEGVEIHPYFSSAHVGMPREALPPALVENGAVYVIRRELLSTGSIYGKRVAGYLMDASEAIDIDTIDDFERAELLLRRRAGEAKLT
jgi:CMP-N,N'-diacetyllegionaminic acid synthase